MWVQVPETIVLPDIEGNEIVLPGTDLDSPLTAIQKIRRNIALMAYVFNELEGGNATNQDIDGGNL